MPRPKTSLERRKLRSEASGPGPSGAGGFAINLQGAPYSVVCPVCLANALAPCIGSRRNVLPNAHPERWWRWKRVPKKYHVYGYYCPTATSPRADGSAMYNPFGEREPEEPMEFETDKTGKILRPKA